ncbi:MAG: phage portal protein [Oscillospiraceae bacterium]|nr:phage portal protein [Oscillospiraceae bacterium]
MVTLNLRDDCVARTATNFRRGMTDKRFLELEITAWLNSPERKRQLAGEMYYDGDQAVTRRKRMVLDDDGKPVELKHLPNNRLVNNQYSKMVDQKTNYSFGRPISFDTEDKRYAEALKEILGARFRRILRAVGEGAWIGGKSWLYPYYEAGELAFKRFPADEVLPFWADADHTILDAAVHVYMVQVYDEREQAKDVVKVEVMHGGGVDCFIRKDDGSLVPDDYARSGPYITETDRTTGEARPYNWERIPLVCFKSSHHELPLLSRVKCLQDAYNTVLSRPGQSSDWPARGRLRTLQPSGLDWRGPVAYPPTGRHTRIGPLYRLLKWRLFPRSCWRGLMVCSMLLPMFRATILTPSSISPRTEADRPL